MKKIFSLVLASLILCSLCLLAACGPEEPTPCVEHTDTDGDLVCDVCSKELEPECTAHKDENADKLCDACGTEFFPRCSTHTDTNDNAICDVCGKDIQIKAEFHLKDQEGTSISGVTVIITDSDLEEYYFITDDDGCATLDLYCGTYRVTYDTISEDAYFPEGYLPIPSTVTVSATNRKVELEILKTVPNGEADRPFPIGEENTEISIPATTLYHYVIYHSSGRNVVFTGSDFKLTYGDKEYTPNAEGKIAFALSETEANENSHLIIENTSESDNVIGFSIYSNPGSYGNPIEIVDGDTVITANTSSGAVYYKYVVSSNGTLTLSTQQMLVFKSESMSAARPLAKVSGDADSLFGVYELTSENNITYTLTITEESIVIEDNDTGSMSLTGSYSYIITEDGELTLTGTDGLAPITLFKGGNTISATCSSNSRQVVISGSVESASITVKAGEEIRILVNSDFSDELVFELAFEEQAEE